MQRIPISVGRRATPHDDAALLARGTDPASGLLTRAGLAEVLARRTGDQHHCAERFALLLLELDGAAAPLSPAAARRLRASIRGADILALWHDTALAVLLPDPSGEFDANGLAPRFAALARRAFGAEGDAVACRVGLAVFPLHGWAATALLDRAESALCGAAPMPVLPQRRRLAAAWQREVA